MRASSFWSNASASKATRSASAARRFSRKRSGRGADNGKAGEIFHMPYFICHMAYEIWHIENDCASEYLSECLGKNHAKPDHPAINPVYARLGIILHF